MQKVSIILAAAVFVVDRVVVVEYVGSEVAYFGG